MRAKSVAIGLVPWTWAFLFAVAATATAADAGGEKLRIVASLFPQYDFARRLAGDRAEVRLLLPPGAESHSYEPTPSDMAAIARADLFIYTGREMEPWAERLIASAARSGGPLVVDASRGIALLGAGGDGEPEGETPDLHRHHDVDNDDDGHLHLHDPHIWLDPLLAVKMVETIALGLAGRDPANADFYAANAALLVRDLERLDREFRDTLAALPRRDLVFGERFAFRYFFVRYGLVDAGPYNGCGPGAEPGPKAVIAAIRYIKDNRVRFIYREVSEEARLARILAEETGAEILAVDSMHSPTADRLAAGADYLGLMRANMAAFARGLE